MIGIKFRKHVVNPLGKIQCVPQTSRLGFDLRVINYLVMDVHNMDVDFPVFQVHGNGIVEILGMRWIDIECK